MQKEQFDSECNKMQLRLPKVSFFGHTWSDKGLSPDPKKIEAVKRMEMPQDVETMRSFLGLVNYLNRFSPCLAELNDPLGEICSHKMEFKLTSACKLHFNVQRRKFPRMSHFHPSIQTLPLFYRLMHPREV